MAPVVDVNTIFGFWQRDTGARSLARLLYIMDHSGVDAALTISARGVWDDFCAGNVETLEVCGTNPRLLPVATVRPSQYLQCREQLATCRERGFQMVRFFPRQQGWTVHQACFRRLIEPLTDTGLPIFWDCREEADPLAQMATLAEYFRDSQVPLILGGVSYNLGEFLAACELHPQLYTDTSQFFLLRGLEIVRDEVGLEHVLFGSNAPFDMPSAPLTTVLHSRLSEAEKEQVLSGNLLRLLPLPLTLQTIGLDGSPPEYQFHGTVATLRLPSPGALWERNERGAGGEGPAPLIDIHAHYGPWPTLPNPYTSLEDLLETCHLYHIERICLSSTLAIGYDLTAGNDLLRRVIEGHEELLGYVTIHPGYAEQSLAQLRELTQLPNFVGAKLHPKHCGYQTDCPEARPLMEFLAEHGLPLLAHTWFEEMCQATANLADDLPELNIILGHAGGDTWECALRLAASRPNMYLELCSGLAPWGKIELMVAEVGAERILFGSDLTLLDPGYTLGTVLGAEITDQQKRAVLYENSKRLLGL